MAAGEENDGAALNKVVIPKKQEKRKSYEENVISNSSSDFTCPICLQILIEPVVMPCEHELCWPCFKQNVEEANFLCPLCRMRISSWARRNSRNGTLVNVARWQQIQQLFPEKCRKRLRGEDDDDIFDMPPVKRTLSKDGELRKEYEEEMRKLKVAREEEMKASEEVIYKLQQEEQRLMRSLEYQRLQDEELARKMIKEEQGQNSTGQLPKNKSLSTTPYKNKIVKGKKIKGQSTQAGHSNSTLDRWFLPTRHTFPGDIQGLSKNKSSHGKSNFRKNSSEDKEDSIFSSSSTFSDIFNMNNLQFLEERRKQEEQDLQFAIKLQKEFDLASTKASEVDRKKGTVDAYLLRTVSENEEVESGTDNITS